MKPVPPPAPWEGAMVRTDETPQFMHKLIRNVFTGKVTERDLTYMAHALLQMSDELAEMRERIKALELAMKVALENGNERV